MRTLVTGTLSNVTGGTFTSGVSSAPINIDYRHNASLGLWCSIEGDTGRSGGSVAIYIKTCYQRSGATYAIRTATPMYLVKSGTSISGPISCGCYVKPISQLNFPFLKIAALASKAGSTQHGTSVTNSLAIKWAIVSV